MPRKYKRSKSVKRRIRKTRGGAACNAVPSLPYQQPCSVGGELDAEFAAAMRGGSRNSPYRRRSGKKSRSYRRRNTKRKSLKRSKNTRRNKRKSMRGSGMLHSFNPAPFGNLNLGGHHANVAYNSCCAPNYSPGVAEPTSYGVGNECTADGSVATQAAQTTQA